MTHRSVKPRLMALISAAACALVLSGAAPVAVAQTTVAESGAGNSATAKKPVATKPAVSKAVAKSKKPVPPTCAPMIGVERTICIECEGVSFFKRIGCQQRVFWSNCKGKRLFEDSYCQSHQDQGPPGGEGR